MNQADYIVRHYERLFCMNGIDASYRVDDETVLAVTVVPATTSAQRDNGEVTIESRIADYLIAAEQLMHDDELVIPKESHRIILPTDLPWASEVIVRPLPPTEGAPIWRWSDPQRRIVRIHTREVSS